MSTTKTPYSQSNTLRCRVCNIILPVHATFCGNCGERVDRNEGTPPHGHADITEYYRITSLARRTPYVQLFFAQENRRQRPVVIRAIDISNLPKDVRAQALAAAQREHVMLQDQSIPDIMPLIDLRYTRHHLYTVADWPFHVQERSTTGILRYLLYTLQDLLQSGIGLPKEQTAISWIYRLSRAIQRLHEQGIVIGDLDPYAIIVSGDTYASLPALMVSWLPYEIRDLLPYASRLFTPSRFSAPEVHDGTAESRSDIYSLGAILYLLLTGIAPEDAVTRISNGLRTPRDLNSSIGNPLNTIVMRALSLEPAERFQTAAEMAEALLHPKTRIRAARPTKPTTTTPPNSTPAPAPTVEPQPEIPLAEPQPKFIDDKVTDTNSVTEHNEIKGSENALLSAASDEATLIVTPDQIALARKHLSRIKTRNQGTNKKRSGKTTVEKELPQETPDNPTAPETSNNQTLVEAERSQASPTNQAAAKEDEEKHLQAQDQAMPANLATEDASDHLAEPPAHQVALEDVHQPEIQAREPVQEEAFSLTPEQDAHRQEIAQQDTIAIVDISSNLAAYAESIRQEIAQEVLAEPASQEPDLVEDEASPNSKEQTQKSSEDGALSRFKQLLSGPLPTLPRMLQSKPASTSPTSEQLETEQKQLFLKRLQRFFLGEQRRITTASAIIETPMRVRPDQHYALRIQIMGRNEATKGKEHAGLGSLAQGDTVHIEVRSALYKNYAYIVQQADVQLPAHGFAAEITIPMHALIKGPGARRERLHIFFMDDQRQLLYEKPFAIELFISPLVHSGQEGHNVLTIPY